MSGAVTLVTGARKGIGRHLAEHYLAAGHTVIGCSRSATDLEAPSYHHIEADVADEKSVRRLFSFIKKECGQVDHVINNAGIAVMNHSLLTPGSALDKVLAVNTAGTYVVCREAAKLMKRRKQGRIVNFSTVAVPLNLAGESAYVTSKAGVEALTRVLAHEYGEFGVTVNAVGPGPIETDLIRSVPADKIEHLVARQALKRLGEFADVANVVDFFLQPESGFVTGQIIYLGGV